MIRFALLLLTLSFCAARAQELHNVEVSFQTRIPMRGGVKLSANVYRPNDVPGPVPALLALTPYSADRMHNEAMWFAQRGFAVVVADCRGRGNSEGTFIPFEYDGKDGYDICKWMAKKEWCDGNIGMFGGSYLGKTQWLTMREHPDALKTIVPIASGAPGIDLPMFNNIFLTFSVQWLAFVQGRTSNLAAFTDLGYWNRVYETYFKHFVPFIELPEVAGIDGTILTRWLLHPDFDSFWKDMQFNVLDYRYTETTVLTITGYFDDNQRGALMLHNGLARNAPDSIRARSYAVIGPWDHGGTRRPRQKVHNLEFGEDALVDISQLQLEWFNWQLRGGPPPSFLRGNTMYYQMGEEKWHAADSLAQMHDTTHVWYLSSGKRSESSLAEPGGLLTTMPKGLSSTEVKYNPADTTGTDARILDTFIDYSWRDEDAAAFPEKAVFETKPLKHDLALCGVPSLTAFLSLTTPDADFEAILYEIRPDSTCVYLTSDIKRARYRNGLSSPSRVERGEVEEYTFDTFHAVCRTIQSGSRLRLVFGFLNSPYYQKNYHSGMEVHLETDEAARPAEIKIGHGSKYPTALVLPVKR